MDRTGDAQNLAEVLEQIDHGELEATTLQRAYIAGAHEALTASSDAPDD